MGIELGSWLCVRQHLAALVAGVNWRLGCAPGPAEWMSTCCTRDLANACIFHWSVSVWIVDYVCWWENQWVGFSGQGWLPYRRSLYNRILIFFNGALYRIYLKQQRIFPSSLTYTCLWHSKTAKSLWQYLSILFLFCFITYRRSRWIFLRGPLLGMKRLILHYGFITIESRLNPWLI